MRNFIFFLVLMAGLIIASCTNERYKTVLKTDKNGYQYEEVTNDPARTRVYTLKNGLRVYLSVNKDEPRINTNIVVRAGSINDPEGLGGMAHYFEHLMFKGTDEIGTVDWEQEKVIIDSLSVLFELHRNTRSPNKKAEIYEAIDKLSYRASQFAIPNEYKQLLSIIGASETNAGTSYEYTLYKNEIPANELDRWLTLEFERFSDPVLRLFHTELETVYEEYNMMQGMDEMRAMNALMEALFEHHPMGKSIIGTSEDLRNPSMKGIVKFFETWYVPNNMAIILSGDLDPEDAIKKIDGTFGKMSSKPLPEINFHEEKSLVSPVVKTIYGHEHEMFNMAFRFEGITSDDRLYVSMIDMMLNNAHAGLIDLDLVQQQRVFKAGCTPRFYSDYGIHFFYGAPRFGQNLDETRIMVLNEIEKIRQGEFETWLMDAVVNDLRLQQLRLLESNDRVRFYLQSFVAGNTLADELSFLDRLNRLTKAEVVAFAREHYKENYVVVNKLNGTPRSLENIEKPRITAAMINRDLQSDYLNKFRNQVSKPLVPEYLDLESAIGKEQLEDGLELKYIKNENNDLFTLMYITEIGKDQDPELALAMEYLPYLGTNRYSPEEIREAFYRLGISLKTSVKEDISYIYLSGLERGLHPGIELLEHLIQNAKVEEEAFDNLIDGVLKQRENQKKDPKMIREAMMAYGKYGEHSAFRNILSEDELREIKPEKLVDRIKNLSDFKHTIFYYGSKSVYEMKKLLSKVHNVPKVLKDVPVPKDYISLDFSKPRVLLLDRPSEQVEVLFLAKDKQFDAKTFITSSIFNAYYGDKMSSVVFQEIREAKALAYYATASFATPGKANEDFFIEGIVITQTDKMKEAVASMSALLSEMVVSENSYAFACDNIRKEIQSERIVKTDIFWTCQENKRLGLNYDYRRQKYKAAETLTLDDMQVFFNNHIKGKNYTYLIIGNKDEMDLETLNSIAKIEELTLEQIFNF